MSHTHKSSGAHGPWLMDDDQVTASGPWQGDLVGDSGVVTLDGISAEGDAVNVWEQATLVGQGPAIFAALARNNPSNTHRP